TMSRTGTVAGLLAHEPEPRAGLHPEDLLRLGIREGDLIRVSSRRGEVFLRAALDQDLLRGMVYVPMHWGARFLCGRGRRGVNELTIGVLDTFSKQPELKHCAVQVEKADLPWRLVAIGPAAFDALDEFMSSAPYAVRTLVASGVRLSLAAERPLGDELV